MLKNGGRNWERGGWDHTRTAGVSFAPGRCLHKCLFLAKNLFTHCPFSFHPSSCWLCLGDVKCLLCSEQAHPLFYFLAFTACYSGCSFRCHRDWESVPFLLTSKHKWSQTSVVISAFQGCCKAPPHPTVSLFIPMGDTQSASNLPCPSLPRSDRLGELSPPTRVRMGTIGSYMMKRGVRPFPLFSGLLGSHP